MKTLLKQDELNSLMQSKGDDPYSLARRMDVAPSTVYRILNGDRGIGEVLPKNNRKEVVK